jgi:hypothetical protein
MPVGRLDLQYTDLNGRPVKNIQVDLDRLSGEPGTGGGNVRVSLVGPDKDLEISQIPCRGGIGTMYQVTAIAPHFRPYSFFQLIQEDLLNTASDDVEFWVKPGDVTGIDAAAFGDLPASAQTMLDEAKMVADKTGDRDLVGLAGEALYDAFGPLRQACFLNLLAKVAHKPTTGGLSSSIKGLLVMRQDRCFARVDADLLTRVKNDPKFKSENGALHDPLDGYVMIDASFKSRDAHANLQITFMQHVATGHLAADIDIDESSGIKHGLEVIRNATFKNKTNPYLIREFLLVADPIAWSLDPGYGFRF